jgi:hypothetical protein
VISDEIQDNNNLIIGNKSTSWTSTLSVHNPEMCKGVMTPLWVMHRPQGLTGCNLINPVR